MHIFMFKDALNLLLVKLCSFFVIQINISERIIFVTRINKEDIKTTIVFIVQLGVFNCQTASKNCMNPPTSKITRPSKFVFILLMRIYLKGVSKFYQIMSSGSGALETDIFLFLMVRELGSAPQLQKNYFSSFKNPVFGRNCFLVTDFSKTMITLLQYLEG